MGGLLLRPCCSTASAGRNQAAQRRPRAPFGTPCSQAPVACGMAAPTWVVCWYSMRDSWRSRHEKNLVLWSSRGVPSPPPLRRDRRTAPALEQERVTHGAGRILSGQALGSGQAQGCLRRTHFDSSAPPRSALPKLAGAAPGCAPAVLASCCSRPDRRRRLIAGGSCQAAGRTTSSSSSTEHKHARWAGRGGASLACNRAGTEKPLSLHAARPHRGAARQGPACHALEGPTGSAPSVKSFMPPRSSIYEATATANPLHSKHPCQLGAWHDHDLPIGGPPTS